MTAKNRVQKFLSDSNTVHCQCGRMNRSSAYDNQNLAIEIRGW
jgi:hypothetical protein